MIKDVIIREGPLPQIRTVYGKQSYLKKPRNEQPELVAGRVSARSAMVSYIGIVNTYSSISPAVFHLPHRPKSSARSESVSRN